MARRTARWSRESACLRRWAAPWARTMSATSRAGRGAGGRWEPRAAYGTAGYPTGSSRSAARSSSAWSPPYPPRRAAGLPPPPPRRSAGRSPPRPRPLSSPSSRRRTRAGHDPASRAPRPARSRRACVAPQRGRAQARNTVRRQGASTRASPCATPYRQLLASSNPRRGASRTRGFLRRDRTSEMNGCGVGDRGGCRARRTPGRGRCDGGAHAGRCCAMSALAPAETSARLLIAVLFGALIGINP